MQPAYPKIVSDFFFLNKWKNIGARTQPGSALRKAVFPSSGPWSRTAALNQFVHGADWGKVNESYRQFDITLATVGQKLWQWPVVELFQAHLFLMSNADLRILDLYDLLKSWHKIWVKWPIKKNRSLIWVRRGTGFDSEYSQIELSP